MPVSASPTLAQVVAEFGGPGNLAAYVRGGAYVPDTPTNAAIATVASSLKLSQFANASKVSFSPTLRTYTTGSGVETAPAGASNVVILAWGGGGAGGSVGRWDTTGAPGGASGSLSHSSYAISGGQTLNYSVGAGGYYSGNTLVNATPSTVTSGSKTITAMNAPHGPSGSTTPGTAGSGGNVENWAGYGGDLSGGMIGGNGGPPRARTVAGTNYAAGGGGLGSDGNDYTPGPLLTPGGPGDAGMVLFYYT